MKTIVVASQKGGAGKTTITSLMAVEANRAGCEKVAMIDTDPQGGLSTWFNLRKAEQPMFVRTDLASLKETLAVLATAQVDLVLIDTPPAITDTIALTLQQADLVVVPARASPNDLWAVGHTVAMLQELGKPYSFVINAVKPRVGLTKDAAIELSQHGPLAPVQLADRSDYALAMAFGKTAAELDPSGKAAAETTLLWSYLAGRLEKGAKAMAAYA